jgi:hypothetical protein
MRAKLLAQLSALTGMRLTMRHYRDWLEGGPGYDHFDKAAKKALGEGLYTAGENVARLPDLLDAFLLHRSHCPKVITVLAGGYFTFRNKDGKCNRVAQKEGK